MKRLSDIDLESTNSHGRFFGGALTTAAMATAVCAGLFGVSGGPKIDFRNNPEMQQRYADAIADCVAKKIGEPTHVTFEGFKYPFGSYSNYSMIDQWSAAYDDDFTTAIYKINVGNGTDDGSKLARIKNDNWVIAPDDDSFLAYIRGAAYSSGAHAVNSPKVIDRPEDEKFLTQLHTSVRRCSMHLSF